MGTAMSTARRSIFAQRLKRVRSRIGKIGAEALLVTNPLDVAYLSGFLGGDSFMIVPAGAAKPAILSDFRYEEELEPAKGIARIVIRRTGMERAVAEELRAMKVKRLAVQGEHLSVSDFEGYRASLKGVRVVPSTGIIAHLRIVKDESEINLMRSAIRIQEKALETILPSLSKGKGAGQSEEEIAARLEAQMKSRGSSKCWFESIVAAGANGSLPHYRPGPAKVKNNSTLLIDWGATYRGYGGDMTRTFGIGKWPAKMREIYQIVLDAQEMAAAALAPGKRAHEIDAIARKHITEHGYGEQFGHGLGHGLGLSKEPPYLNPMQPDMVLEPGHVVTVEPGIYLPGVGGVRIEDLYVIRAKGAENLCSMPKDLKWATL
jgi:Xaa-Pro aminopeptidase